MGSRSLSALFTWRSALTDPDSSATALERHVGLTLSLYMSERGDSAFPSIETLAASCGRAQSTVRCAVRELEAKGWLTVKMNRGRGHTNVYVAQIPDASNPPETGGIAEGDRPSRIGPRDVLTAPPAPPTDVPSDPPSDHETHRTQVGSREVETTGEQTENHRRTPLNPPGSGPEVVIPRHEGVSSTRASVVDFAAADLDRELRLLEVSADARAVAAEDPERARAWLELGKQEASTNVGGYVAKMILSRESPSQRGPARNTRVVRESRNRETIEQLIRNLGASMGADEARYKIDVEWGDLTSVERSELHEHLDELVSDTLPTPITNGAARSEADVA